MRNLVFDPATIPAALPLMQLSLYGIPEARDRYERRMRGIMSMEALEKYDVTSRLQHIQTPTLVIWGQQDIRGDVAEAQRHARKLPSGKMIVLDQCGHLPYLERPAEFNAMVANFIANGL
jgi:pimeloyl-ACP methyl ester carboxylesterase